MRTGTTAIQTDERLSSTAGYGLDLFLREVTRGDLRSGSQIVSGSYLDVRNR